MKHIEFLKKCQNHWTLLWARAAPRTPDERTYGKIQDPARATKEEREKNCCLIFFLLPQILKNRKLFYF
jgi:hypothetical protein